MAEAKERVGGSIKKEVADRLNREADARVVSPAKLIEKALEHYLPLLPPVTFPDDAPSTPGGGGGR